MDESGGLLLGWVFRVLDGIGVVMTMDVDSFAMVLDRLMQASYSRPKSVFGKGGKVAKKISYDINRKRNSGQENGSLSSRWTHMRCNIGRREEPWEGNVTTEFDSIPREACGVDEEGSGTR